MMKKVSLIYAVFFGAGNAFHSSPRLLLRNRQVTRRQTAPLDTVVSSNDQATTSRSLYWIREVEGRQQRIHYARQVPNKPVPDAPAVLLLNGFGVGFFHWDRNVEALAESTGQEVWTMDYLGQGDSWPVDCDDGNAPSELGLRYSADDWIAQTIDFIEAMVLPTSSSEQVALVGNSLGGLLATFIAAQRPDLVAQLTLENATPVWGGNLPGWDGRLPGPPLPRAVGRFLYDSIRDPASIEDLLTKTYYDSSQLGDLPARIRQVTLDSAGGHAAFASIVWGRPAQLLVGGSSPRAAAYDSGSESSNGSNASTGTSHGNSFYDALSQVQCDLLLLYGAEDPWCGPAFGRAAARARAQPHNGFEGGGTDGYEGPSTTATSNPAPMTRYIELSPCGHCPHHEAPDATDELLADWLRNSLSRADGASSERQHVPVSGSWSGVAASEVVDIRPKSLWERALVAALR